VPYIGSLPKDVGLKNLLARLLGRRPPQDDGGRLAFQAVSDSRRAGAGIDPQRLRGAAIPWHRHDANAGAVLPLCTLSLCLIWKEWDPVKRAFRKQAR
jgi:hypothetical protein